MAKKKKSKTFYKYKCSITDEEFTTTAKAENPEELISVKAYYELNADEDDRPEAVKKRIDIEEQEKQDQEAFFGDAPEQ